MKKNNEKMKYFHNNGTFWGIQLGNRIIYKDMHLYVKGIEQKCHISRKFRGKLHNFLGKKSQKIDSLLTLIQI